MREAGAVFYSIMTIILPIYLRSRPLFNQLMNMNMNHNHFPIVKNNLSPTSPRPGFNIPVSVNSLSIPASHSSTPSGHSSAARTTPGTAPSTESTMIRCVPHSRSVWMAAAQVPPVAMTGSRMMASREAEAFPSCVGGWWFGRLL